MKREVLRGRLLSLAEEASRSGLSMADIYAEATVLLKEIEMQWALAASVERMQEAQKEAGK